MLNVIEGGGGGKGGEDQGMFYYETGPGPFSIRFPLIKLPASYIVILRTTAFFCINKKLMWGGLKP